MSVRPNLFVVGFGRSGTTSLHNYLAQHPQIFMSAAKEPNHFSTDIVHGASRRSRFTDRDEYLALFADAGDATVRGESSTMYVLSAAARDAIAEFAPDAHIVISIRRPVDFLVSWHAHGVGIGYETERTLAGALDAEAARRGQPPHHLGNSVATTYRETIEAMPDLVKAYIDTFRSDRVKVVTFDQLTEHQAQTYSDLCGFLGVDASFVPDFAARNYDPSNLRLMSMFRWVPESVRSRVGPAVKPLVKRIGPLIARARSNDQQVAEPVDDALLASLSQEFAPVVERLAEVTGHDLSHW